MACVFWWGYEHIQRNRNKMEATGKILSVLEGVLGYELVQLSFEIRKQAKFPTYMYTP